MKGILSPSETAGLAGATLDSRIRRAASHVSDLTFAAIAKRLREDALANDLTYERDGKMEAIPVMLRPILAMNEQLGYVQYVCQRLTEALKRLPALYLNVEKIRRIIAITPAEEAWLKDHWSPEHDRNNTIYGRLDAVCDFTAAGWQDTLHFMEANLSGVGGINYSPLSEQLVMRDIVPTLLAHDPQLKIELPRDQRDLFIQVLIDHSRAIGRKECNLCFVEPKYAEDGINEQSVLTEFFAKRHGLTITHADPSELRIKDGDVYYDDTRVDVAYRDYETRDLIAAEEELGKPLDGMRLLFKQNRVVSSLVGDFDHKSCWEILTDPAIAETYFSAEECRVFRRHVLWTRVVSDRRTTSPHNASIDLLEYIRTHREELVMKPNRAYGGEGVTIGPSTSAADWDKLINEAVSTAADPEQSWVVQRITRLPVSEFPIVGKDGRVFSEPFYSVMGFAPTDSGLGIMCRVSQKQVVNVAQHGGMAAVLVGHAPSELKTPKRSLLRVDGAEQSLRNSISELLHLDNAIALLEWDEETNLPAGARDERGHQLAALESTRHTLLTSDHLGDLIEEVAIERNDNARWTRELHLLRELRRDEIATPPDLLRAFANARARSSGAWEEARKKNDFKILEPALQETVSLAREIAQAVDGGADPYEVLLDDYEPGMTRARLDEILSGLKADLLPMAAELQEKTSSWPAPDASTMKLERARQLDLAQAVLVAIGFDFKRGNLATSTHPATTAMGLHDVRLSIRPHSETLTELILTTMHEGGHGLYDQGYAKTDHGTLLAAAPSMGMHEGQARLWENHVGRSREFWAFVQPILSKFKLNGESMDAQSHFRAANKVGRSPIRTTADELTYHLHILLRCELEIAMVSGDLKVTGLKSAWNERSQELLGLTPKSDLHGVLQDGHWASGMFGYFPTYTLGSLYAAQLIEAYAPAPQLASEIARGDFKPLLAWLRKVIHTKGDMMTSDDLIAQATGKPIESAAYFRCLQRKYA